MSRQSTIQFSETLHLQLVEDGVILAEGRAALWDGQIDLLAGQPDNVQTAVLEPFQDVLGEGRRWGVSAAFQTQDNQAIRQTVIVRQYERWPEAFILQWEFKNIGDTSVTIDHLDCPSLFLKRWSNHSGKEPRKKRAERLWSFQGAAVSWGQDFAFPLPVIFERDNYLGHLQYGEGGGIPLVYFWDVQRGIALAHIETLPKDWYMPVQSSPQEGVRVGLQSHKSYRIPPGQTLKGLRTLISLHQGDFYAPLFLYREILSAQGLLPAATNAEDYEPAWCSWGYEFDVKPAEMTGVLPVLQDLGIRWLTLDDRWFDKYGDWNPRVDTFPGGEAQMRQMVDKIHQAGAYAQIWWYPLAVEDGRGEWPSHHYGVAEILNQHPDWLILNEDGSIARNNRGLAMLDPSLPMVQEYITTTTWRFIQQWGFDGHKLDNVYTVAPCYNPAHLHRRPEESVEALAQVYRIIFETTRSLKPRSVTQICSCGTLPMFSLLPYMDQAVTADPTCSAQIRQRIKFFKALLGSRAAVFADHVELSDGGDDFASQIGAGGIPATKFVWPEDMALRKRVNEWWGLSFEKRQLLKNWLDIYRIYHLSDGDYLNLYDLAFDKPEAYAIRKDGRLYYAFYTEKATQNYAGTIELRGLEAQEYRIRNYVKNVELGNIHGPKVSLNVQFQGALLLEASPK